MASVKLARVFRMGATDLPDPDSELSPDQVLDHFKSIFPTLRYGKVEEAGVEGDMLVYRMESNSYKANG